MIRIKPGRCGYGGTNGYTCQRLPQLQEWMFNENNAFVSQMTAEFDKLPLRVKGMVFTEETIDMGWSEFGPHPEVPELSCRSNTDPASDATDVSVWGETGIPVDVGDATAYPVYGGSSGWLDLFNSGYEITGGTQYFYHNISGTTAATSDVYIKVTGVEHEYHDIYLVSNIPTFKSGEQEMEMGPGLLEPMLDTDFAPVGIDTIPAWEAGLDADIFTNIVLNAWKGVIDDRIRNIYWRLNNMPIPSGIDENLLDLLNQDNTENECPTFQITLTGGTALQTVGSFTENTYTVSYGTLTINGVEIHLLPLSGMTFHFEEEDTIIYIWLTVDEDEEPISGEPYTAAVVADAEEPEADHVYLIGGVAKIVGGTENDSYVLFKIFQEDCITEVTFDRGESTPGLHGVIKSGTEGGEVIVELPGSTETPAAGILQPAVNIWLNDPRSESVQDVPTVEAVYNFIHGITAYNGPVADATATIKVVSETTGTNTSSTVTPGAVVTITKNRYNQATETEILDLSAKGEVLDEKTIDLNEADEELDAARGAWEEAGEPSSGEIYERYQAAITAQTVAYAAWTASYAAYNAAYNTVNGAVTKGVSGTVFTVNNIILSGSTILGESQMPLVPTVRGVYAFIHDIYALGSVGTITYNVNVKSHVLGTPGVVYTIDVLDKDVYESGAYYQDEVPTVKAVMDYLEEIAPEVTPNSISGTLTVVAGTTTTEIEGETVTGNTYTEGWVTTDPATPVRGTVEVSKKIVVAADPDDRALSNQAVPSVNAIYEFMHSTELNVTDSGSTNYSGEYVQALVTAGTISDAGNNSGRETWNGIPGTVMVVKNVWMNTYHNLSASAVPSVEAVYKFIHGMTVSGEPMLSALATPGAITPVTGAGGTVSGYTAGTMGVFFVATAISYPASVYTVSVDGCVPSVQAVIDYVTSYVSGRTASLGYIQVISDSPYERVENASYGLVRLVKNIDYSISQHTDASATETAVPSAAAVYEFIHARYNATSQKATALATAGTISTTATTTGTGSSAITTITGTTFTGGEPGTVEVSVNIEEYNGGSETGCVPTADAVVKYVHGLGIGNSESGLITTGQATVGSVVYAYAEVWSPAPDAPTRGTVEVSDRIQVATDANYRLLSHEAVPSVWAVYDFVHSTSDASTDPNGATRRALAYQDSITIGNDNAEVFGGTPGTVYLANNLKVSSVEGKRIYSAKAVPTVKAVYEFVHSGTETTTMSSPLATPTAMTASTTAPTLTAVPGTMYVADSIEVDSTGTITAANCVPTAQAVVTYVNAHGGGGTAPNAVHGALTIGGTGNAEYVVNDGTITHVQGIVNVLDSVKYAKTVSKRAVSPDAVPSVIAVYNFIHSTSLDANDSNFYVQALATGATVSTSGTTASCASTPGTVRVANDIKVKSGTTTVPNTEVVVPTVQAVVTWVAEHGSSAPVATVNNFSTAGLVYVTDYIPLTSSHPTVTVPTVDAVYSFVTGSSISGGIQYPNYSVLTNTNESSSGGTNLSPNTTYYVSGGGWLRVTVPSSSGCSCVTIDGSYNFGIGTPGGSGPMTWLIPVGPGHSFYVGTSASTGYVIKFDGICSQSGSSKSAGTTRALMKLNGISKYDPEDPESYEDTEEALMQKYGTTDTTGSQEDLEPISLLSQEAEANKNHVITQYESVVDHTRMFVTNSSRSTLCAEHVEELCEEASEYYDAAMSAKTLSEAQAWLAQGDAVKAAAYEWVGKTQAYGAAMTVLHNVDEKTDYIELADGFIATAEERYDSTIAENENLLVIGVTGGAQFVDIAHRASQEAVQWKAKLEEEIESNATVYSRASSIASDAYATASGAYSKLEDKAQEASKYVSSLEKPQER